MFSCWPFIGSMCFLTTPVALLWASAKVVKVAKPTKAAMMAYCRRKLPEHKATSLPRITVGDCCGTISAHDVDRKQCAR
jgi:hypothetical protein